MDMFLGLGQHATRLQHSTNHTNHAPLQAHLGTYLNNFDNPHQVTWGALRGNLDYMEMLMKQQGNHMEVLIPTWRYQHTPFPPTKIMDTKKEGEAATLEVHTGFRYTLDIKLGDMDKWQVGELVKLALENPDFKQMYGAKTHLTTASKRSNGHQGQMDRIEAPPTHTLSDRYKSLQACMDVASILTH